MPSISISSGHGPITEAMHRSSEWMGMPETGPAAVYLSSGNDTRPLSITHPEHIRAQCGDGPTPEPTGFYVFVDKGHPWRDPRLRFDDGRTCVRLCEMDRFVIGSHRAWLQLLTVSCDRYDDRKVAVLRIRATNDQFTQLALAEEWKTHLLITTLDGCTGYGGQPNNQCEVDTTGDGPENLRKLEPDWLVTDHFDGPRPWLPRDLAPGNFYKPLAPHNYPLRFKHAGVLATPKWPGAGQGDRERYVRLYEVLGAEAPGG